MNVRTILQESYWTSGTHAAQRKTLGECARMIGRMMSYRCAAGEKRECQNDALRIHFDELPNVQLEKVTMKFSEYVE